MFKKLSLIIIICLASIISQAQTEKNVLFLGNSYTGVNNLPDMVDQAATSAGDILIYDSYTPGGCRLMGHAADAMSISKIFAENWDYVVLQAQSQEPSWSLSQMQQELFPYAEILCDTIRVNSICTKPMFYMTWGRQNGDSINAQYVSWVGTYEGMDSALRASYTYMAQQNNTEISAVGPVWRYIRNNHPAINLYSSDESHPSIYGSYAAACCFYTSIFKNDPTLITWNSSLSAADALIIRNAVKAVVYDSLNIWDYTISYIDADFSYTTTGGDLNLTLLSTIYDSVRWDFGDGTYSTLVNPTHTYNASNTYDVSLYVYLCNEIDTLTIPISITTSLEEYQNSKTKVYPNPSNDKINIYSEDIISKVEIFTLNGQMVLEKATHSSNLKLDINDFERGMYILKIISENGDVKTIKISFN